MFRFKNEYILYALLLIPLLIALYIYVRLKQKNMDYLWRLSLIKNNVSRYVESS